MLKLDPKNTELLRQKQDVLNKSIDETRNKLTMLKEAKDEADKKMAEGTKINEKNYRALQRKIINTESKLKQLELSNDSFYKMGQKAEEFGNKINAVSEKINSLGNKLTTRLTLPIAAAIGAGLNYNAELEKLTTAYSTFLGDSKEAEKVISQIKNDASKTPFDVTSLVKANQMLISTGENAEASQKTILALGDAVTATGGGNDELTRMASNLQQIKNAGKATAMDIRQFAYAGIDVYGLLADYMGKTTQEVKDMEISYEDLSGALQKASSQGGKYYNSMNKSSETLAGQTKQLKAELKDMAGELTKGLMPIAKKTVSQVKEWVKRFDNLSDSQKENIVKIGLMVAAAGPLLKIIGTLGKTVGTTAKGLGTFAQAVGVVANKTTSTSESVNKLAKVLKGLTSPVGLVGTAIVGSMTVASIWLSKATEETSEFARECKKSAEETLSQKEAINELRNTIDSGLQTDLDNISRTQDLWKELQNITDENGKIKEGYELRAKVITGELSEALGTEISVTDGVIDKYKELQSEVDKLILKKKAEAILAASQEKYNKAMADREQKEQELIDKEDEYNQKLTERDNLYSTLSETEKKYYEALSEGKAIYLDTREMSKVDQKKIANLRNIDSSVSSLKGNVSELRTIVNNYTKDIEDFSYNTELAAEGTTESLNKMIDNVGTTYEKNGEIVRTEYARQILAQQNYLSQAKKDYEQAVKANNEAEQRKSQITINESKRRLETLVDELVGMTSATEENSPEVIEGWKQLAIGSYSAYYDQVSQLPEELSKKIQEMTGITIERTPELVDETKHMAESVLNEFKQNEKFRETAIDNLEGLLRGLENEELRQLLKDSGIENVEEVIKGIQEGNLAEGEGEKILESLNLGLSNTTWQKTLWDKARGIASTLSGLLTVKANVNGSTSNLPGHKSGLDYVPYDNYIARLHKGERVLTAEENKQLIQMEKASRLKVPNMKAIGNSVVDSMKTVFTTPNITFNVQKMDEANLNSAFNYINRRLGSQY